ncbi:MAG TPA: folylpolyglutamate synthase/dihydrofolate synthase family protein [Bacillota bacterium]|nr:folylpolyglutamate synthase/dihydrofolate synthase family protein [Bacillota bacterium]
MNYDETLDYIRSIRPLGTKPGLARVSALLALAGNPQNGLVKYVHVTGTNGKGSVCASLAHILANSGYKTGLYTSPYVVDFTEQIQINGFAVPRSALAQIVTELKTLADTLTDTPSEFELITAAAFVFFAREQCDIAVIEVGMGGESDATNVIRSPVLSVITSVALDHTAYLGRTIREITLTKSGIIKDSCPVLFAGDDEQALEIVRDVAKKNDSAFFSLDISDIRDVSYSLNTTVFSYKNFENINLSLLGKFQVRNAAAVIECVDIMRSRGWSIPESALRKGLEKVVWKARFELFSTAPYIIIDGGHNPQCAQAVFDSMLLYFGNKKAVLLTGMMKDKDCKTVAHILAPAVKAVFAVRPDNPRAIDPDELAEIYRSENIPSAAYDDIETGVRKAYAQAVLTDSVLLVTGSFYMYADVVNSLRKVLFSEA